jgi:hypothetical protein
LRAGQPQSPEKDRARHQSAKGGHHHPLPGRKQVGHLDHISGVAEPEEHNPFDTNGEEDIDEAAGHPDEASQKEMERLLAELDTSADVQQALPVPMEKGADSAKESL